MDIKLAACPCCGSAAKFASSAAGYERWIYHAWVQCRKCPMRTQPAEAGEKRTLDDIWTAAAEVWNLRPSPPPWQPTHRHTKGGLYRIVRRGVLEADLTSCVVYDDEQARVWVRPSAEFDDGRFTFIITPEAAP